MYIKYVAMYSVPSINPANQAPWVQTGHAQGINNSHRLIMGKTIKKSSETMRPKAYTVNLVLVRTVKNNYFSLCTN